MAIVENIGRPEQPIDDSFCTPNRTNAGEPNGSVTPQYAGELLLDTTNNTVWKALSLTNTSWVMMTTPGP